METLMPHPHWFTPLALLAALLLPACAATADMVPSDPAIYVVRHLHTPEGERDPDLLPEGQRVAILLGDRLAGERIAAIYISDFKRTRQTAGPLAERLGLEPILYDPRDTPALVARVRAGPLPALIIGHSNTVPDIVDQLGGTRPADLSHPDFGDLWRVGPDGATIRARIEP
ncbi:MAG: histidine phosphatase family protein [Sphingomonas sp.]|nr:histidine phosphatase family protein [Sphingomonas sp.]